MATEMVVLEGITEWPKLFEFNRDKPEWSRDTDGEYSLRVILDDENVKKIKAAGSQKKLATDPDGRGMVFAPTRPHKARNDWAGGPPKVAGPDGTPWDTQTDGLIGNGSKVRVLVAVYDAGSGRKGTRLEAVQVVDHVPFISDNDGASGGGGVNSFFKDLTGGQPAPAPAPKAAAAPVKASAPVSEDSIPF